MKKTGLTLLLSAFIGALQLFSQDVIFLKNGDEMKVKVAEVGTSDVKYKKFSNLDGPVYVISKSEIMMIKYENGDKDVYTAEKTPASVNPPAINYNKSLRIENGKRYVGDKVTGKQEFESLLRADPDAFSLYQSGKGLGFVAIGLSVPVGVILGMELAKKKENRKSTNFVIAGVGFAGCVGLAIMSGDRTRKALSLYNHKKGYSLKIQVNDNGAGVVMRF